MAGPRGQSWPQPGPLALIAWEGAIASPHALPQPHPTDRLLGQSPAIAALRAHIQHLVTFDRPGNPHTPTVLLHGETGTGKGLVARLIHDSGARARGPFIDINCAAIPETLLGAELYGFTAGAFTDAKRAKTGLFEAASGGTLLLDEIDALPLALQAKLLTAIEEKRVRRMGAVTQRSVDVKLIAATQADLGTSVTEGRFRGDLYQRLAVVLLDIPPLRERGDDVLILAEGALRRYAEAYQLPPKRLSGAAEAWLRSYQWPGNVRELNHLLERVTLLSPETIIGPDTLERLSLPRPSSEHPGVHANVMQASDGDAARISQALRQTGGNVERAARLLGLSRKAVRYRMRKYGITRPQVDGDPRRLPPPVMPAVPAPSILEGEGDAVGTSASSAGPPSVEEEQPDGAAAWAPTWEQKLVAVLAVALSWPLTVDGEVPRCEPWTLQQRWERAIVEKVRGVGGFILQRSPSLILAAFGVPSTPEQLPQRALQAALASRQLVVEASVGESSPELRQAVHWGPLLVGGDAGQGDPAQVLAIGETLTRSVRLLGYTAPGEILVSPEVASAVGDWCMVEACEGPFRGEPAGQSQPMPWWGSGRRARSWPCMRNAPSAGSSGGSGSYRPRTPCWREWMTGTGRWLGWWESPAWASRACAGSSSAHWKPTTG